MAGHLVEEQRDVEDQRVRSGHPPATNLSDTRRGSRARQESNLRLFLGQARPALHSRTGVARRQPGMTRVSALASYERNPSARNVPISRVRAATSAYIVFMAPNTAPM